MAYDTPRTTRHYLPSGTYGASSSQVKIVGPAGRTGYVKDIEFIPTADCVGTTSVPEIAVGATAGSTEYARFRLGTAVGTGYTAAQGTRRARSLTTGNPTPPTLSDFVSHVQLETARIPADTNIFLSGVAGVGGTPAGTFSAYVEIEWY
jgi:hypothetical protein